MNTKELLKEAIEELKTGNNLGAQEKINQAYTADADNHYEDLCASFYSSLLIDDDSLAAKFKNMYKKNIKEETKENGPVIINNNNNNNNNNGNHYVDPNRKVCKKKTSLILCALGFIGLGGFHKFYEGKIGMGILYFLTLGLFFLGTIYDFIKLLGKNTTYYAD